MNGGERTEVWLQVEVSGVGLSEEEVRAAAERALEGAFPDSEVYVDVVYASNGSEEEESGPEVCQE